jgi:hypothetical protein
MCLRSSYVGMYYVRVHIPTITPQIASSFLYYYGTVL